MSKPAICASVARILRILISFVILTTIIFRDDSVRRFL